MEINVLKCHGSLNDFILIDSLEQHEGAWDRISDAVIRSLCDRGGQVGADGILILDRRHGQLPVLRVFNADGREAEISGNGLRCAGRYLCDRLREDRCRVTVHNSPLAVSRADALAEGVPGFCAQLDGIRVMGQIELTLPDATDDADGGQQPARMTGTLARAPNPHIVILAKDPHSPDPVWLGRCLLPDGRKAAQHYNISYARRLAPARFHLTTFERGVGRTLSCGSAACSLAASCSDGSDLVVYSDGGLLKCRTSMNRDTGEVSVLLTGNATFMWAARLEVAGDVISVSEKSAQVHTDEIRAYDDFLRDLHRKLWDDHKIPPPSGQGKE